MPPSVYRLKPAFQGLLRPLARRLAAAGVTPNGLTVGAVVLSGLVGGAVALAPSGGWPWLLVPLALFARMALNALDGMLAREHGMATRLGAYLNELGDVASDAALYLPFALLPGGGLAVVVVVLAGLSELAGVLGASVGSGRRYDGPMGKSDRAVVFGGVGLLLGLGVGPGPWLGAVWAATGVLLAVTVWNRVSNGLRGKG